jgi:hypothetical protein
MTIALNNYDRTALSVTGTEVSIATGTTPAAQTSAGCYQVVIDGVANMVRGDEFRITIYEKAVSGGTQRILMQATLSDAQSQAWVSPTLIMGNGWDVTMVRVSASSRAFDCSIRKVS